MKFSFTESNYDSEDPSIQREILEKLFLAEKNIAVLRFFIILLNSLVYLFLLDKKYVLPELAISVIAVANAYAVFVVFFQPYKKYPLFLSSYFTSGTDAVLIALWITATGAFESPFYLLWYVSLLAITMRYSMTETYVTAIFYSLLYLGIYGLELYLFERLAEISDLILRLSYLFFMATLGALLSKERIEQIMAKAALRKSEEDIRLKKKELREAYDKLELRIEERTKELAQTNKELKKTNEEIDSFVYSASHDLKSPILNIEALLQILYENKPKMSDHEMSIREKLEVSVKKMKRTINNLAEVARSQKEMYEDVGEVRFQQVLYDLISENEEIIKRENIQLEYNFSMAETIVCSHTCIKSIMYNFLTNAIKYKSPERAPVIRFYTEKTEDHIALMVQDNGLGIDLKKNGKKLFALFKRFHDHVEGAGIGLYTVKKMVEKYNGDISVESELGVGTTFRVSFKIEGPKTVGNQATERDNVLED